MGYDPNFFIGGLIYVNVLGKPMVIINKLEIARELLDKRGANYSDRPRLVLLCEMYVQLCGGRISIRELTINIYE